MYDTGIVQGGGSLSPDLQQGTGATNVSKDSYDVSLTLPLNTNKDYAFQFRFILANEDPLDTTERLGPYSANFVVPKSQILSNLPDLTTTPANVVIKPGYYSYAVSWDKPTFNGYVETIIQESSTTTFTDSSTIVWRGTSNQANIMTLDTNTRYIRIYHEDQWYHGKSKAYISGPITPKEPVTVDTVPPSNASGLSVSSTGLDPNDKTGFAGYATVTWTASTDPTTKTYRIRWTPNATEPKYYEYAIVPVGTTSYKLTTLIPGITYYVTIASEDEYNNRSTFLTETTALVPAPTDGSIANWSSFITAGANKNFRFGSGIDGDAAKNGIDFKVGTGYTNNYWYASGNFRVGNDTNYMLFNGTDLSVTGNIIAKGGNFSGNILMSTSGASIYSGSINTNWDGTASQLTGTGFILNSKGLALNGTAGKVRLLADTGEIIANAGNIGGWQLTGSTLSNNNATLDSSGVITLGTGTNQVVLSSTDPTYRLWIGNNNGTYGSFKVDTSGKLWATGADITGNVVITGGSTLTTINSKHSIFTGSTAPTANKTGDLWFDSGNNNRPKIWNGSSWVDYRDSGLQTAVDDAATALAAANKKNRTFIQSSAPSSDTTYTLKTGDIWIDTTNSTNILKLWNGSAWTEYLNTSYASKDSLDGKLSKGGYVVANASNQITGINSNGIQIWSGSNNATNDGPGTGARMVINSSGLALWDGVDTTAKVSILSNGSATFRGSITGASGTFGGTLLAGADDASTGYINTGYDRTDPTYGSIRSLGIKAIAMTSTSNSGTTSSWYPYSDNNHSLGTTSFKWRNLFIGNIAYFANGTTYSINASGDAYLNGYGVSGGYGVTSDWSPRTDSTSSTSGYTLGLSTKKWQRLYAWTSTISTSDARLKHEIETSPLGLEFIKKLKPVKYKWIVGNYKDVMEEKTIIHEGKNPGEEIVEKIMVPKVIGKDELGKDIIERVEIPGKRHHYGFIAQDVKQVLDDIGIEDFAGWVKDNMEDPDSYQSLSYEQFIAPLTKAVQELSDMVELLQQEISDLKGK